MNKMPDNFVDCIITSPPYNKGFWSKNRNMNNGFKTKSRRIDYEVFDDTLKPEVYEQQQREVIKECLRILKPSGSFFYNHIDILNEHNTIHPKFVYDYPLKQIIIWNRKNTPKLDNSYFFPINEYVFWIKKTKTSIPNFYKENSIYKKNIWEINPVKTNPHPAPFPIELVGNCILSTTKENDLIYDPYIGSGTTAKAAIKLKRNYIGSEINEKYIKQFEKSLTQTKLF
tara:strand:- start:167 stop:850 length:684 start_codon:yes stop_codon:yes gene_type:complete